MNQLQRTLSNYLSETGESMRSLSLRAGLHEKSVSRILTVDGHRPIRASLDALSRAMQRDLPCDSVGEKVTFAGLIARIPQKVDDAARAQRLVQRLRWLVRSAGWVAEFETVDRGKVVTFFAERNAASFGINKRSFSTYKAEIMTALDVALPRARGRMINDLDGTYAEVHRAIKDSALPTDMKMASGAFLVFLNDQRIAPGDITTATLEQYFLHRLEVSPKGPAVAQKHVSRIVALLRELASRQEFVPFGFVAPGSPFSDGRDKYGVGNDVITAIMSEFDSRIAPWALGRVSRDGKSIDEFIASLDAQKPAHDDKKRALLRRSGIKTRSSEGGTARADSLSAHGFLLPKGRWSAATLSRRRGYIVAGVKALYSRTGYLVESLDELTDPEVAWSIAVALEEANDTGFHSGYAASVVKTLTKIAAQFLVRDEQDIMALREHAKALASPKGMSERNIAKLKGFSPERIPLFLSVSDRILDDVNARTQSRRHRRTTKVTDPDGHKFTADQCRDIMCALAHDLMLIRAPRSANVLNIRLDWIRWYGSKACIVIPSVDVKLRDEMDDDLPLDLSAETSRLLRQYVEKVRPLALLPDDKANPYLFPGQGTQCGRPYESLLGRLVGWVFRIVGVKIHPHLYRHLIGWLWLRENIDMLPVVQQLLGHKNIQTTIEYYAAIDESLAMQRWNEFVSRQRKRS